MSDSSTASVAFDLQLGMAGLKMSLVIQHWSNILLLLAGLVVLQQASPITPIYVLLILSFMLGIIQQYYALRVRYDLYLFAVMINPDADLNHLDQHLYQRFGKAPTGLSLKIRMQKTQLLLRRQSLLVALQTALMLISLWLSYFFV